jgi:predicted aldo/keto reductase-like oxidoreductase
MRVKFFMVAFFAISTAAYSQIKVATNNNVGIGVDAPVAKFSIGGVGNSYNTMYLESPQQVSYGRTLQVKNPEDVDERIENEILEVFEKAKAEGKVRHIGFTGHQNPFAHKRMFEKTADNDIFETLQMPVNAIDMHFHSFIENALPIALDRNFGVLAMKTLSDGRFFSKKQRLDKVQWTSDDPLIPNYISVQEALNFVWSLPVSVLITGAENKALLEEKIELARAFDKFTEQDRITILDKVSSKAGGAVEYYKKVQQA